MSKANAKPAVNPVLVSIIDIAKAGQAELAEATRSKDAVVQAAVTAHGPSVRQVLTTLTKGIDMVAETDGEYLIALDRYLADQRDRIKDHVSKAIAARTKVGDASAAKAKIRSAIAFAEQMGLSSELREAVPGLDVTPTVRTPRTGGKVTTKKVTFGYGDKPQPESQNKLSSLKWYAPGLDEVCPTTADLRSKLAEAGIESPESSEWEYEYAPGKRIWAKLNEVQPDTQDA